MVKTTLFEPQPPEMQASIPRHSVDRRGHCDRADDVRPPEPSARWAIGNDPTQGGGRGTYVVLDTSSAEGIGNGLTGASPKVTEPSSYSADGKAVYRGKGGRCLRSSVSKVGETPKAKPGAGPAARAAIRHWSAGYAERCTSGAERGRRNRSGQPPPRRRPTLLIGDRCWLMAIVAR